ncbi:MAG: threonine synthase [Betaproteobacteria bacterium]|nr:threonine synthase [Betaproteobacteria bacterium]
MKSHNMTYLTCIEGADGKRLDPKVPHSVSPSAELRARYDLDRIRREVSPRDIAQGPATLWRYAPLLPVENPQRVLSLGEGYTPLLPARRLARKLGLAELALKDEGRNPSGTFKDRGAAVAVSCYAELGVKTVAHNSSGNAGGSWSLYAARTGLTCVNLLPTDVQPASLQHCRATGQPTYLTENWHEAGRLIAEACERNGWLNICTLREPYRLEGKKTMGLEIAEQSGWKMPDAVFYPMGGGLGAIAIWKAFDELRQLGWVEGKLPRLYVTQYEGCAPAVKAFEEGRAECAPWGRIDIPPGGLKSPNPPGGRAVLKLIREHGGGAVAVATDEALAAIDELAREEGVFACPESATTLVGLRKAIARGWIAPHERVVLVVTGSGLKSIPTLEKPSALVVTTSDAIVA